MRTLGPVPVRIELRTASAIAEPRAGSRSPPYDKMSCYLLRASATSIASQLSTDVTRGRTLTCLDLGGRFNKAVTITQAKGANSLPVPTGQVVIEFLGVKSSLGDCAGKTLDEIWGAGDPEIYSLARYEGPITGGENLSVPLTYVQDTTPNRVSACPSPTPANGPVATYSGFAGQPGSPNIGWSSGPGGSLPPKDGLNNPMTLRTLQFPMTFTAIPVGTHAELSFLIAKVPGTGSFTMRVDGGAGVSDCSNAGTANPAGLGVGYFGNYIGSWQTNFPETPQGRSYRSSISPYNYQTISLDGTDYFYISTRAVSSSNLSSCSFLRIDSVVMDFIPSLGRGGDVFRAWPNLEIH